MARGKQRAGACLIETAVGLWIDEAPVIHAYRDVVEQAIDACEVKVDHAGDAPVLEKSVIAEQVGVHRPSRQVGEPARGLERELAFEKLPVLRTEKRRDLARRKAPPLRPARVFEIRR